MIRITLVLAALAATLLAACGGSGGDDAAANTGLSKEQIAKLRTETQADLDKHGRAIGCGWLMEKYGDQQASKAVELAGVSGKWLEPWSTGTIGNLPGKPQTQFATLYDGKSGAKDASLTQKDGDGFTCFVSQS